MSSLYLYIYSDNTSAVLFKTNNMFLKRDLFYVTHRTIVLFYFKIIYHSFIDIR